MLSFVNQIGSIFNRIASVWMERRPELIIKLINIEKHILPLERGEPIPVIPVAKRQSLAHLN